MEMFLPSYKSDLFSSLFGFTNSEMLSTVISSIILFFFDGFLAIYVFYFLSAYVISLKFFDTDILGKYWVAGFSKRYFRLVIPVMASVFLAYTLLKLDLVFIKHDALLFANGVFNEWLGSFYRFPISVKNAFIESIFGCFFNYSISKSYNPALWTMGPELIGSLTCFLLYAIFRQHTWRYLFFVLFLVASLYLNELWMFVFILGYCFCDLQKVSGLSYFDRLELVINRKGVLLILIISFLFLGGNQNMGNYIDVLLSVFIVLLVLYASLLKSFFSSKFLVWIGKISFGLYLIHLPVLFSFSAFLFLNIQLSATYKLVVLFCSTLGVLLLASYVFTVTFDKWSISFSKYIGNAVWNVVNKKSSAKI